MSLRGIPRTSGISGLRLRNLRSLLLLSSSIVNRISLRSSITFSDGSESFKASNKNLSIFGKSLNSSRSSLSKSIDSRVPQLPKEADDLI